MVFVVALETYIARLVSSDVDHKNYNEMGLKSGYIWPMLIIMHRITCFQNVYYYDFLSIFNWCQQYFLLLLIKFGAISYDILIRFCVLKNKGVKFGEIVMWYIYGTIMSPYPYKWTFVDDLIISSIINSLFLEQILILS